MGSEATLSKKTGYLDKASYEKMSKRSYPTFSAHRADIYELFEAYRKEKGRRNEFDAADR